MKPLFTLTIILLSVNVIVAQENGFRNNPWGASFADVKSVETSSTIMDIKQKLIYKDVLSGDACEVYYMFNENDQLTSGMYHFTRLYNNAQLYVDQYDKFLELLTDRYGEPAGEKQTWRPSYRELDRTEFGKEIAEGRLSLSTEWATATGTVKISLARGSGQQPHIQIYYHCTSLNQLAAHANQKSAWAKY